MDWSILGDKIVSAVSLNDDYWYRVSKQIQENAFPLGEWQPVKPRGRPFALSFSARVRVDKGCLYGQAGQFLRCVLPWHDGMV